VRTIIINLLKKKKIAHTQIEREVGEGEGDGGGVESAAREKIKIFPTSILIILILSPRVDFRPPPPPNSNRDGCDRKGITTAELNASAFITPINVPAFPVSKHHAAAIAITTQQHHAADDDTSKFTFSVLGSDVVVSAAFPYFFAHSVAVHVLTDKAREGEEGGERRSCSFSIVIIKILISFATSLVRLYPTSPLRCLLAFRHLLQLPSTSTTIVVIINNHQSSSSTLITTTINHRQPPSAVDLCSRQEVGG
jgi:hypothetical protein